MSISINSNPCHCLTVICRVSKMNQEEIKITKKEIWLEVKTLVIESQRATRLALFAIGLTLVGLTIPSLLNLFDNPPFVELVFVVLYLGLGIKIMIDEGIRLKKLKKELEKIKS